MRLIGDKQSHFVNDNIYNEPGKTKLLLQTTKSH